MRHGCGLLGNDATRADQSGRNAPESARRNSVSQGATGTSTHASRNVVNLAVGDDFSGFSQRLTVGVRIDIV